MSVQRFVLGGACVLALALAGCKSCKKSAPKATAPDPAAASRDAGARGKPGVPSPTDPDPGYEARRDELLRRGDPEMMKPAKVIDTSAPPVNPAELIKVVSKDVMMVKQIRVDLAAGTAELPGRVSIDAGPLEYVAVALAGKAYESLFIVDTSVVELRLVLTLLGYEGSEPAADGSLPAATPADTVDVAVKIDGKERPLSAFLIDRKTGKAPKDMAWQVVGFRPSDRTAALTTLQLLTLVGQDAMAPLRIIGGAANPYAGPDAGLGPNADALPAVGSEVTLVIRRGKDAPPPRPYTAGGTGGAP